MYGWRARIGLVIPANNTVIEPEFARMVPDGVASFGAKIRSHGLSAEGIDMADQPPFRVVFVSQGLDASWILDVEQAMLAVVGEAGHRSCPVGETA